MPGSQREVANAEEEGVEFVWLVGTRGLPRRRPGSRPCARTACGSAPRTPSGRQTPEVEPGSSFRLDADLVIKALGFDPEDVPALFGEPDLTVTRWGTLQIDWGTMMTSLPGVFAAGDIVRGASLVVWAIRDGRDAAAAIHT